MIGGVQMYRVLGTVMHAVMSADASCRGLLSPRNGPIVMEFTQGEAHENNTSLIYVHNSRCTLHVLVAYMYEIL